MKKHLLFTVSLLAMAGAGSSMGFAQRQTAVGPGTIPLNTTGMLGGVDMASSGTTGTLSVGVPGGPEMDIYTLNNPPVAGLVAISTAASSQGNVVFNSSSNVYGAVGVTQPGGPFLLAIAAGPTGTTVNFMGPVYATTLNVTGTGAVNFNSGSTNITATNFAGDGTISLAPNTTVIGALTTTAGAQTGNLALGGGSVLNGAVGGAVGLRSISVTGGSATAGVSASISGATNAYSFSLGTNTLNVGGALTIANGGTGGVINTTLASPTVFGNIAPVGATNLGPTLQVNVTVPSTALIPVGTQFGIIQTRPGTVQSGTNGSIVTVTIQDPANPLYVFAPVPGAGTIAGLVTIQATATPLLSPLTPPPGVVLPPTLPIAVAIVPVLVALSPAANGSTTPLTNALISVLTPINALSDPVAVVSAIAQLAPAASGLVAPLVAFQTTSQFQNLVLSRLDNVLCNQALDPTDDAAVCKGTDQRSGMWLKAFGLAGDQGSQGGFAGYTSSVIGTMIGYDAPIDPATRVGLGLGYARSTIGAKGFSDSTDFDTYNVTAYIGHQQGPWYINGNLSYGWNDYSGQRNVSFPGFGQSAKAHYSGQDYTAFVDTGYHIPAYGFTVTPLASLQYTRVNTGNYTETGGGAIDLAVGLRGYDFIESALGVKIAHDFKYDTGTFVPDVHVKWLHELGNPTMMQNAAFAVPGSPSFATTGFKAADDMLNIGAGVAILSCGCTARTWSLEAVYDYYRSSENYSAHQGMLRLTGRF